MQQQHGQSGAELGIINIQQTSYDERRDNRREQCWMEHSRAEMGCMYVLGIGLENCGTVYKY